MLYMKMKLVAQVKFTLESVDQVASVLLRSIRLNKTQSRTLSSSSSVYVPRIC
jgi:hypothetical protein